MKTKQVKTFDSVAYFRAIKEKMAKMMEGMTLAQKKEFMKRVREWKVKLKLPDSVLHHTICKRKP
jgi:hypothetical protein